MEVPVRRNAHLDIQKIKDIKRTMFLALYPRHCPFCSKILPSSDYICNHCQEAVPYIKEPVCYRCGKQIHSSIQEYCYDCRHFQKSFQKGLALFHYNEQTRPLMADLKYKNRRVLVDYITMEICKQHKKELLKWNIEYIVPIPIHKHKYKIRGYNQAALIARALSEQTDIPVIEDLLLRIVDTPPQKNFSARARYQNLSSAFQFNEKYASLPRTRILLLDDIYTTGATMEACAKILLSTGFHEIFIYSVCIGTARD